MAKKPKNEKPTPHIPLPFEEVMQDVLKVKPPPKPTQSRRQRKVATRSKRGASNT